jgi:hypothetical protein
MKVINPAFNWYYFYIDWTKTEELVTEESQPPKFRNFCYKKGCATTGFKLVRGFRARARL